MLKNRTTVAIVGDLLASMPGQRIPTIKAAERIQRHRSGVDSAMRVLSAHSLAQTGPDPEDRRRTVLWMTEEQAKAWLADAGASCSAIAGFNLEVSPTVVAAAKATNESAHSRRAMPLRFAMWSDGAIAIEGLARKQLTLSAFDTARLAEALAALPEGGLQALAESALKPSFTLTLGGRDYPLTPEQTSDLVAYIEQLPAKAIRAVAQASRLAGVQKAGTDHRVHRLETAADRADDLHEEVRRG